MSENIEEALPGSGNENADGIIEAKETENSGNAHNSFQKMEPKVQNAIEIQNDKNFRSRTEVNTFKKNMSPFEKMSNNKSQECCPFLRSVVLSLFVQKFVQYVCSKHCSKK